MRHCSSAAKPQYPPAERIRPGTHHGGNCDKRTDIKLRAYCVVCVLAPAGSTPFPTAARGQHSFSSPDFRVPYGQTDLCDRLHQRSRNPEPPSEIANSYVRRTRARAGAFASRDSSPRQGPVCLSRNSTPNSTNNSFWRATSGNAHLLSVKKAQNATSPGKTPQQSSGHALIRHSGIQCRARNVAWNRQ